MACNSSCFQKIICALLVAAIPYLFGLATGERTTARVPTLPEVSRSPDIEEPIYRPPLQRRPAPPPRQICMWLPDGTPFCCRNRRPRLSWRLVETPYGPEYRWHEFCA
jgi:hypothetical protein